MCFLETIAVAFSMYSALPMPQFDWNERNMRYALCAFPLVGAVCGLLWWGWDALCAYLALPAILRGAVRCILPALVTGGIHLDGYADTADALASHAGCARRQEILRDPHCGAFAVIRLCVYFVMWFALCCAAEASARTEWCVGLSFVLSRTASGLALACLPIAEGSSLARTFADAADRRRVRVVLSLLLAVCAVLACFELGAAGGAMLLALFAVFAQAAHTAKTGFGGLSGDLAGWFLVKAEFWMLAAYLAAEYGKAAMG